MKRNVTAVLLSISLIAGSFGGAPLYAAEVTAQEAESEQDLTSVPSEEESPSVEEDASSSVENSSIDGPDFSVEDDVIKDEQNLDESFPSSADSNTSDISSQQQDDANEKPTKNEGEDFTQAEPTDSEYHSELPITGDTVIKGISHAKTEGTNVFPQDDSGKSSEELFADYVDECFEIHSGTSASSRRRVTKSFYNLTGIEQSIYDIIAADLPQVAAGERSSTIFEIPVDGLGLEKTFWTADELGITSILVIDENGDVVTDEDGNTSISEEAVNAVDKKTEYDLSLVINSLLADHPYQLYWYDKTTESSSTGFEVSAYYDDALEEYVAGVDGSIYISFPVADDYSAGDYLTDTSIGLSVQSSVVNAGEIIELYEDKSDYEKLCGYRDTICSLASYNENAAAGAVSYGNPWQIIWVFDEDPSTNVVCEGYAKAFKYLCDQTDFSSDISCISVTGTMAGGIGEGPHMWNIVTMEDGKNYLVDVTNCDEGTVGNPDLLFLQGYDEGSYDDSYIISLYEENRISYRYDEDTLNLYPESALVLSPTDYRMNGEKPVYDIAELIAELPEVNDPTGTQYYYYRQLSDLEKALYQLFVGIDHSVDEHTIIISGVDEYTADELLHHGQRAFTACIADFPIMNFYWDYNPHPQITKNQDGTYTYTLKSSIVYSQYYENVVLARAADIIERVGEGDEYTRLRELTEIIMYEMDYDPLVNFSYDRSVKINSCIVSCLAYNVSVCGGFADTMKYLCDELGIPCIIVGNGGHAWNYIQMEDGNWYSLDASAIASLDGSDFFTINWMLEEFLMGSNTYRYKNNNNYFITDLYLGSPDDFSFPQLSEEQYHYEGEYLGQYSEGDTVSIDSPLKFLYKVNEGLDSCTITGCDGKQEGDLIIPSTIDGYTVTAIDGAAFWHCTGFTGTLVLPDTIETIGISAFAGCCNLSGELHLPISLKEIHEYAFVNCTGLSGSLQFPESLEYIGKFAFYMCSGLTGAVNIPDSLLFNATAFLYTSVSEYSVSESNGNYMVHDGIIYSKDGKRLISCPPGKTGSLTIANGTEIIGEDALTGCSGLTGVLTLPDSVVEIEKRAFSGCEGITGDLILPDSIEIIRYGAFSRNVEYPFGGILHLPQNLKILEDWAFLNCGFTGVLSIPDRIESINGESVFHANSFTCFECRFDNNVFLEYYDNSMPYSLYGLKIIGKPDNSCLITCDANGGTFPSDNGSETFDYFAEKGKNTDAKRFPIPARDNTEYGRGIAWCYDKACKQLIDFSEFIPTEDITIYAAYNDVTGVRYDEKAIYIVLGDTYILNAITVPEDALVISKHYWVAGEDNIVTVDDNGLITAIACGKTSVRCQVNDHAGESIDVIVVEDESIHVPTCVDAVPATYESDGNIKYYKCEICGKLFEDEDCEREINESETVIPALYEITIQPWDLIAAVGQTIFFYVGTKGTGLSYQWQWSSDEDVWENCTSTGCDTGTLSLIMDESLSGSRYRCIVSNGITSITSDEVTLILNEVTGVRYEEKAIYLVLGDTYTLNAITVPEGAPVIRKIYWVAGEDNIVTVDDNGLITAIACGKTSVRCQVNDYAGESIDVIVVEDESIHVPTCVDAVPATYESDGNIKYYKCEICGKLFEDEDCEREINESETVIPALFEITVHPSDISAYAHETVSLSIGTKGIGLSYQWQWSTDGSTWKNCTGSGYNSPEFSFEMARSYDGRQYRCRVKRGTETIYSEAATVTLMNAVTIITDPVYAEVKIGETAVFTVEAEGKDLRYQWQWSADGNTWKNCTGAGYNNPEFSFKMAESYDGRQYRCRVKSGTDTVYSESARVILKNAVSIITDPADVEVKSGETAVFTVEAEGEDLSYQWQYSTNGSTWRNCTAAGYNSPEFSFKMAESYDGRQYRCRVKSGAETAYSLAAMVILKNAVSIITDPEDVEVKLGETAVFTVEAEGEGLVYQWQYSVNGTYWINCTGSSYNTDTFSFKMQAKFDGRKYRCVITADGNTLTSNAATVHLKQAGEIVEQPQDCTVGVGDDVSFHVGFSGVDPEYQWQYSVNGTYWINCIGSSYDSDTFNFVMQEKFDGRQYRCVIKAGGMTYTSDIVSVRIGGNDMIISQPEDVTLAAEETASFHVGTSGIGLTYQWQWSKDGNKWKNCTGEGYSTDTFSFVAQTKFSGRRYRCVVKYGTKTEYSESGLLTVTK